MKKSKVFIVSGISYIILGVIVLGILINGFITKQWPNPWVFGSLCGVKAVAFIVAICTV